MARRRRSFPWSWLVTAGLTIAALSGARQAIKNGWLWDARRDRQAEEARSVVAEANAKTPPIVPTGDAPGGVNAEQLVDRAILALDQYPAVFAKVRQRTRLFGQEVLGSGAYEQGPASSQLTRLELKLVLADQVSSLQQVCDGEYVWTRREMLGESELTRVELRGVEEAAADVAERLPPGQGRQLIGLGAGGLPRLLRQLQAAFDFDQIQAVRVGDLKAWQVEGRWSTPMLGQLVPEQTEAIAAGESPNLAKLPDHAPDRVLLYLGQNDLFPYRLDLRRQVANHIHVGGHDRDDRDRSLQTWEFYNVRLAGRVSALSFIYDPGNEPFEDVTERYAAEAAATMVVR